MMQFTPAMLGPGGTAAIAAGQAIDAAAAERLLSGEELINYRKMQEAAAAAVTGQSSGSPWLLIGGLALVAWLVLR